MIFTNTEIMLERFNFIKYTDCMSLQEEIESVRNYSDEERENWLNTDNDIGKLYVKAYSELAKSPRNEFYYLENELKTYNFDAIEGIKCKQLLDNLRFQQTWVILFDENNFIVHFRDEINGEECNAFINIKYVDNKCGIGFASFINKERIIKFNEHTDTDYALSMTEYVLFLMYQIYYPEYVEVKTSKKKHAKKNTTENAFIKSYIHLNQKGKKYFSSPKAHRKSVDRENTILIPITVRQFDRTYHVGKGRTETKKITIEEHPRNQRVPKKDKITKVMKD